MLSNKFRLSILTSVLLTIFSCSYGQKNFQLSPKEFSIALASNEVQLVDVRTDEEYDQEHLDKAINIDWKGDSFDEEVEALDKSKPVYVYCRSGNRSAEAAEHMRKAGFRQVYEMKGGMEAWQHDLFKKAPAKEEDEE
ncbi:rhodanese-like domain-containing protein [Polluticoccus soli]|uniref:rhodanese-like domain-containing protein n=1 Tax=Polluticoccus soli TaxID=3034150 RepID=UPI0023E31BE8|nr:rhodanese-like domain-containing protein [Flavipsychrobacter sp. JY13-12]